MTDYIKKVKLISKKYDSLLEEYEQRIGISNIIQLLKPINEHFVNECHGRIIRKARKKYRSNFPIRKREIDELLSDFDTFYTSYLFEILTIIEKLAKGENIQNLSTNAEHIKAWDIALCSINKKSSDGLDHHLEKIETNIFNLLSIYIKDNKVKYEFLRNILTVLPSPLYSYEDSLKNNYINFMKEYYPMIKSKNLSFKDIDLLKHHEVLRDCLYSFCFLKNRIYLLAETKSLQKHTSLYLRRKIRKECICQLSNYITSKDDLNKIKNLIKQHSALTYINVYIESKFGFKGYLGLVATYLMKQHNLFKVEGESLR